MELSLPVSNYRVFLFPLCALRVLLSLSRNELTPFSNSHRGLMRKESGSRPAQLTMNFSMLSPPFVLQAS